MEVTLIAHTALVFANDWGMAPGSLKIDRWMETPNDDSSTDPEYLIEFAGRACYQSFDRPREATRRNVDYLANIIKQGHESVLEHASATFYVTGVSRALTHELVRHRHLSFSQLSQRFVNEEDAKFVMPPALQNRHFEKVLEHSRKALKIYEWLVNELQVNGLTRKEAREAARAVLPNATETRLVVTGNMRAWRDVLKRRFHTAADAEIREFARLVLEQLRSHVAPSCFQDFPEEPYGSGEK